MNVVYRGVTNPMTISFAGISSDKVSVYVFFTTSFLTYATPFVTLIGLPNALFKEDTAFYSIIKDCQFNCYVMDIYKENDSVTAYVTECGLYFYSDIPYSIGDSLFKFSSPKHN